MMGALIYCPILGVQIKILLGFFVSRLLVKFKLELHSHRWEDSERITQSS